MRKMKDSGIEWMERGEGRDGGEGMVKRKGER